MTFTPDTIFAFATPSGTSGVAVLRLSGAAALEAARRLGAKPPAPRMATLVTLLHPDTRTLIDKALMLYFPAPHSFTGEEVVELHLHGSRAVRVAVLQALSAMPELRMAAPGEFTRRAFLNGKMDALQAEGLADVLAAETPKQLQQAWRQAVGGMSNAIEALRGEIMRPLALLEAYIDFPDEEIPEAVMAEIHVLRESLTQKLQLLLDDGLIGEKVREGLEIVIWGPPNSGKSSLINALTKREVAIVSDEAGTTRDILEAQLEIGGFSVVLVDTAGLRESEAMVEKIGIEKAKKRITNADIVILLTSNDTESKQSLDSLGFDTDYRLICENKSDIAGFVQQDASSIPISVKTGDGMDVLIHKLGEMVAKKMEHFDSPLITRARHRELFSVAMRELGTIRSDMPIEILCEHLRRAANAIGNITGKIHQDELLDIIFREFCIGK